MTPTAISEAIVRIRDRHRGTLTREEMDVLAEASNMLTLLADEARRAGGKS